MTKQTKTIQFSLTSPAVMSTGWTTGERQRGSVGSQKKRKKKAVTRKLPPDILDLLRKVKVFAKCVAIENVVCRLCLFPERWR